MQNALNSADSGKNLKKFNSNYYYLVTGVTDTP